MGVSIKCLVLQDWVIGGAKVVFVDEMGKDKITRCLVVGTRCLVVGNKKACCWNNKACCWNMKAPCVGMGCWWGLLDFVEVGGLEGGDACGGEGDFELVDGVAAACDEECACGVEGDVVKELYLVLYAGVDAGGSCEEAAYGAECADLVGIGEGEWAVLGEEEGLDVETWGAYVEACGLVLDVGDGDGAWDGYFC